MRVGVLGNSGSWYCQDLVRSGKELRHEVFRIDFPRLTARVGMHPQADARQQTITDGQQDLTNLDAVIVRTMPPGSLEQVVYRMDALLSLQAVGVTVLNDPKSLECAVDKYLTTAKLAAVGLAVPPTVVCENSEAALAAFTELGGDVVVKPIFGAEGRGIVRVSDYDLAFRTFRTLERIDSVLYLQKFVEHEGFDVRVLLLDGKVLGGIRRRSQHDFRTNISQNGTAETYELSELECELAQTAAEAVGATFAGVDLLYDRSGKCYVIEVNAVPGWRGFSKVTGIDVAERVIQFLESMLYRV